MDLLTILEFGSLSWGQVGGSSLSVALAGVVWPSWPNAHVWGLSWKDCKGWTSLAPWSFILSSFIAWQIQDSRERNRKLQSLLRAGLGEWKYHFYCILLISASHKISPDPRGEEIDPTFWWEELKSHISKEHGRNYCCHLWIRSPAPCFLLHKVIVAVLAASVPGAIVRFLHFFD